MRWTVALAAAVVLMSCTSSSPVAVSSPSASSLPVATPPAASPSAGLTTQPLIVPGPPLPVGKPVAREVLAPATVLPIARLCQLRLTTTADGNYTPTLCRGAAINVLAWRAYVGIAPSVMSLSRSATMVEVEQAMCRDGKSRHDTNPELEYAYGLSAAYYGWKFGDAPMNWLDAPDPSQPLC
jgi:hypothetical protein